MKIIHVSETKGYAEGACSVTGEMYTTDEFSLHDLNRWRRGTLIQDAFPYLSTDDREFLMTQISPTGWNMIFHAIP